MDARGQLKCIAGVLSMVATVAWSYGMFSDRSSRSLQKTVSQSIDLQPHMFLTECKDERKEDTTKKDKVFVDL